MNIKGTYSGLIQEVEFVRSINRDREKYKKIFNLQNDDFLVVHVTKSIYGEIQKQKIKPKADAYIINVINKDIYNKVKSYYINERDLEEFIEDIDYNKIPFSGISIKDATSDKYQILKMNPNTFYSLFGSNILAAGASIYCKNLEETIKNKDVLKGWNVLEQDFILFFKRNLNPDINIESLEDLGKIKSFSNNLIKQTINSNLSLKQYIFKGTGNFPEPYTANWFYEKNQLRPLDIDTDFTVTTGSGRSKGDYTLVIKPK